MNAYHHQTSPLNTPRAATARILVVRYDSIGDTVLSSVLCNSLKKTFPKAQVDYLVHEASAELFANHPYIDNVIRLSDSECNNPFKYWRKIRQITAAGYDLVVDAQCNNKSAFISLFARKRAICIGQVKTRSGFLYTNKINITTFCANKIAERLRLLEPLVAMGFDVKRDNQFMLTTPMALKNDIRATMEASGVDFKRPVFLMSVTDKNANKRWDQSNMQAWAQYAMQAYNAQLVLFSGSVNEQNQVNEFHHAMGEHSDIYPNIKTDSLSELNALMSHCDLFFGNEGGARHLAQAIGLPSAVVMSPKVKKLESLVADNPLHKAVEWDDVSNLTNAEKLETHRSLEVGGDEYRELYRSIKPEHAIEVLEGVAEVAGIAFQNKSA